MPRATARDAGKEATSVASHRLGWVLVRLTSVAIGRLAEMVVGLTREVGVLLDPHVLRINVLVSCKRTVSIM